MAEANMKHFMNDGTSASEGVVELPEAKRQKMDEMNNTPIHPPPLISEEQKSWTVVAEPPDIKHLKEAGSYFTERILHYQMQAELVRHLVVDYQDWMKDNLKNRGLSERHKELYSELCNELKEDERVSEKE